LVADTILYGKVKGTLLQLQEASQSITKFTVNLSKISDRLNQNDNVAGILLNDTESASSMKVTLKNLESGSKKLDENLEALQHNFLLRGFFRKKEKIKERESNNNTTSVQPHGALNK
jgi:phospholipid/cholesterol/gamma-HCH transport system substrate-binding protein